MTRIPLELKGDKSSDSKQNRQQANCTFGTLKPEPIVSDSGEYKIFPDENAEGDKSIKLYRVDGDVIPWEDQRFLVKFAHHPDTWVASVVPADDSRYVIGLLDSAIETGSYKDIVAKLKEVL